MRMIFFGIVTMIGTVGCASGSGGSDKESTFRMPYSDDASAARGEAFAGDLSIRKDMPARESKFKPFDFYFKRCALNGNETYYSRTSYDCNMPGF